MLQFLKNHLIPHPGNNHRPHLLTKKSVLIIISLVILVELIFLFETLVIFPSSKFLSSILPTVLSSLTNLKRAEAQIPEVKINPILTKAAELKAADMAAQNYFAHESPTGKTPWNWLDELGYNFEYAGENLAVNFLDSEEVIKAWMDSDTHRENILNQNFDEVGFGITKGKYNGKEAIFVVQMFGREVKAKEKAIIAQSPSNPPASIQTPLGPEKITPNTSYEIQATSPNVAGASNQADPKEIKISLSEKIASAPKNSFMPVFYALLTIISVAFVLNLFIKIKIQHPDLIINGLALILIVTSALIANQYLATLHAKIL